MTLHIMLDFETLSLKENAVLLALGAVAIDAESGAIKSEFYAAIDPRQQPNRDLDAGTVLWWLGQDKAAQVKITEACAKADQLVEIDDSYSDAEIDALYAEAAHRIDHVAQAFVAWHGTLGTDKIECWSNGAVDHGWLNNMLTYSGLKNPVPYYLQRDYRTLKALFPAVKADELDGFIAHHALWDAKYQAKHLVKLLAQPSHVARNAGLIDRLERAHGGHMVGHDQSDQPKGGYSDGFVHGFGSCVVTAKRILADDVPTNTGSTILKGEDADAFIAAQATLVDEVVHG